LRRFEKEVLDAEHWSQVVPGVEVKMVAHPDGAGIEQFVLCRSESRREKEAAMLRQKFERLLRKLQAIDRSLRKRPSRDAGAIERRIDRWLVGPLHRRRNDGRSHRDARRARTSHRPGDHGARNNAWTGL
jgi:hypothetical protein